MTSRDKSLPPTPRRLPRPRLRLALEPVPQDPIGSLTEYHEKPLPLSSSVESRNPRAASEKDALIKQLKEEVKDLRSQLSHTHEHRERDKAQALAVLCQENEDLRREMAEQRAQVGEIAKTISTAFQDYQRLFGREQGSALSAHEIEMDEIRIYGGQSITGRVGSGSSSELNARSESEYSTGFV